MMILPAPTAKSTRQCFYSFLQKRFYESGQLSLQIGMRIWSAAEYQLSTLS